MRPSDEFNSVRILLGDHQYVTDHIVKTGQVGEEDLNCLSAYYSAMELLEGDPEKWVANRIRELCLHA